MSASAFAQPRYSFTAYCTPHNTAFDDIRDAIATGADGIGLSELKIEAGRENELGEAMERAGLISTFCVPQSHTLLGMPFGPAAGQRLSLPRRIDMIAASIERLARFDPLAIVLAPGATGDSENPAGPIEDVYEALPILADVAADHGQQIAFELIGQRRGSAVHTIPDMVAIMDAVDRPNIGLALDNFHSWPEENLYDHIHEYADRVLFAQICDVRIDERSGLDREMPGLGRRTAVPWVANLLHAGYDGWWEFEVFSDDGTYEIAFPDSYWQLPHVDFLRLGREHFDQVWNEAIVLATAMRHERGSAVTTPLLAFNQRMTPHNDFFADVEHARAAGFAGIGLDEIKMPAGIDSRAVEALEAAGVVATYATPDTWPIVPGPLDRPGQPTDMAERADRICESIARFSRFGALGVVVAGGRSGDASNPTGSPEEVADPLAQIARFAASQGMAVALEVLPLRKGSAIPECRGIGRPDRRDRAAEHRTTDRRSPRLGRADRDTSLTVHASRVLYAQLSDIRETERTWADRLLPGDGLAHAPAIAAALRAGGYDTWWELEVFSDDGTFEVELPDSLWRIPHIELLTRGRERMIAVLDAGPDGLA